MGILWIVILIWIIVTISRNKKKTTSGSRLGKTVPGKASVPPVNRTGQVDTSSTYRPKQAGTSSTYRPKQAGTSSTYQPKQADMSSTYQPKQADMRTNQKGSDLAKQRELKERLTEKYKTTQKTTPKDIPVPGKMQNVVYSNPKINSGQKGQQNLSRSLEGKTAKLLEEEVKRENSVLGRVEDLMVKGPDIELTFERDFLAEGMDMLNRIQM